MNEPNKPWKAAFAAVVTFLSSLLIAVQEVDGAAVQITVSEWLTTAIATLTALGGVYGIDNRWGTGN